MAHIGSVCRVQNLGCPREHFEDHREQPRSPLPKTAEGRTSDLPDLAGATLEVLKILYNRAFPRRAWLLRIAAGLGSHARNVSRDSNTSST